MSPRSYESTDVEETNSNLIACSQSSSPLGRFRCPVCLDQHSMLDAFVPHPNDKPMTCKLCRGCAREAFKADINRNHFPIACPVCRSLKGADVANYLPDDVVCSVLEVTEQDAFHRHSLLQAKFPDARCCPVDDCDGFGFMNLGTGRCRCEECNLEWCGHCGSTHDARELCQPLANHTEELHAFYTLAQVEPLARCPSCGITIKKVPIFNHITCTCKHHFCFNCRKSLDPTDVASHFYAPDHLCPLFFHDDTDNDISDYDANSG